MNCKRLPILVMYSHQPMDIQCCEPRLSSDILNSLAINKISTVYNTDKFFIEGYKTAAKEIKDGNASFVQCKQRGLYLDGQDSRIEWDRGYEHCVCAYRLGYDVDSMIKHDFMAMSALDEANVVIRLLDNAWGPTKLDPRKSTPSARSSTDEKPGKNEL